MVSTKLISLAIGATFSPIVMAASSSTLTTSLLVVGYMPPTITGSVVDNKDGKTTWALGCGTEECLALPGKTLTITENPSTIIFQSAYTTTQRNVKEIATLKIGCDINTKKSEGICKATTDQTFVSGSQTITTATTTTTSNALGARDYHAVVVTAGADKLDGSEGAAPAPTRNALLAGVAAAVGGAAMIL